MAPLVPELDISSDDELKPVKRRIKAESPILKEYDPMKRKQHVNIEDVKAEDLKTTLPKKFKQEASSRDSPDNIVDLHTSSADNEAQTQRDERSDHVINLDSQDADEGNGSLSSPFLTRRASVYLPISPICQSYALSGVCAEHLSPLILTYYPPFKGVILAYENAFLSDAPDEVPPENEQPIFAKVLDEYAASYIWVTADFLLFAPSEGDALEGHVNYQNESFIGLVCFNFFNARIARERMPRTWVWVGHRRRDNKKTGNDTNDKDENDTGFYRDETGSKVEGRLKFRVAEIELTADLNRDKSLMRVEGTLLAPEEETKLQQSKVKRSVLEVVGD